MIYSINTEVTPFDDDTIVVGGRVLKPVPTISTTLAYSPELKAWDSVHKFIPKANLSRDLILLDSDIISTIGRVSDYQHSIIEKSIPFGIFAILDTVNILCERSDPKYVTIKNSRVTTDRIPFELFNNAAKKGERVFMSLLRSYTIDNEEYEEDFWNGYAPIKGSGVNDDYIEGEFCTVRLEFTSPFKLYNIDVNVSEQKV